MTDASALLAAVLDDPADDTARLVLADCLRESDDPDTDARGRFLWAGVTASRFRDAEAIEEPLYYEAQKEITAVTVSGLPARWLAGLGLGPNPLTPRDWAWDNTHDRVTVRIGGAAGVFARGLLSELSVKFEEWYALATWPVERATVTDMPGCHSPSGGVRTTGGWRRTSTSRNGGCRCRAAGSSRRATCPARS